MWQQGVGKVQCQECWDFKAFDHGHGMNCSDWTIEMNGRESSRESVLETWDAWLKEEKYSAA